MTSSNPELTFLKLKLLKSAVHILEHVIATGIPAHPSLGEHWPGTTPQALQSLNRPRLSKASL